MCWYWGARFLFISSNEGVRSQHNNNNNKRAQVYSIITTAKKIILVIKKILLLWINFLTLTILRINLSSSWYHFFLKKTTLFKKNCQLINSEFFLFSIILISKLLHETADHSKIYCWTGRKKRLKSCLNLSNQYITPLIHTDVYNTSGMLPWLIYYSVWMHMCCCLMITQQ